MPGEDTKLLEEIARTLQKLSETTERQAGGKGGSGAGAQAAAASQRESSSLLIRGRQRVGDIAAGRAFGGGVAGLVASAGLAAAGTGAAAIGSGLVSEKHGGTFGAGAARGLTNVLGSVPFLGELGGLAGTKRITNATEGDLNAATNKVARFAGPGAITPGIRRFLAKTFTEQNRNVEADRQANRAEADAQLGAAAKGQGGPAEFIAAMGEMTDAILRFVGVAGGSSHHT